MQKMCWGTGGQRSPEKAQRDSVSGSGDGDFPERAIQEELCRAVAELSLRELASSAQWAAELSVALPDEEGLGHLDKASDGEIADFSLRARQNATRAHRVLQSVNQQGVEKLRVGKSPDTHVDVWRRLGETIANHPDKGLRVLKVESHLSADEALEQGVSPASFLVNSIADAEGGEEAPPGPSCGGGAGAKMHRSLMLAKAHFGMREYGRAAHALSTPPGIPDLHRSQPALFLRFYALYLAGEKRREEDRGRRGRRPRGEGPGAQPGELKAIQEQLGHLHQQGLLDGLGLYLYGVVLRGAERATEARGVLLESVRAFPCNWSAWLDLLAVSQET
ncbi:unnamed protein product [Prorocentrum cordatum]|uniref:Cdc23 domain-containing protein n=1 Tax=Prorocentrum cordatum TaxID=2364126 RepID=A0ABN9U7A2_9DINO|nr:unnamed protein product [Polarella glacialis]